MMRLLSHNRCLSIPRVSLIRTNTTVPFSRKKKQVTTSQLKYNFDHEAKNMLLEIENAITPMKALNKDFEFVKLAGEFQVNTGENGWFMFKINNNEKSIYMASPISGPFEYKYCPENKNWLNTLDKHDMRGMIVRDMLRKFIGMPKF